MNGSVETGWKVFEEIIIGVTQTDCASLKRMLGFSTSLPVMHHSTSNAPLS
jgi:hypothetical protein